MVQSDHFLDSPLPTLYDMFNDRFGEPVKPIDQERAIALDSQPQANESRKPPADAPLAHDLGQAKALQPKVEEAYQRCRAAYQTVKR